KGAQLDSWDVRALVPAVPEPETGGDVYQPECPAECQADVARGATVVSRSGDPGIAAEWVLRMPLNQPLDLEKRAFATQDLLDERPRTISPRPVQRDGLSGVEPSKITVALVEACAPRVRAARVTHLEVHPDAIVPIPKGFRTYRWTELEG